MHRRKSHKTRNWTRQHSLVVLLLLMLAIGSSTSAQGNVTRIKPASQNVARLAQEIQPTEPATETTAEPSQEPTDAPTEMISETPGDATATTPVETATATPTVKATGETTAEPAPEITETPTAEPTEIQETAEPTPELTPEVTEEPTEDGSISLLKGGIALLGIQTSCQIDSAVVQDVNDPYIFTFSASGNNIATFEWDFPGGVAVDRTGTPVTWDFGAAGTYNYSLTCTSTVDTGELVLGPIEGSITILDPVVVNFSYNTTSNADTPSVTVNAANTSTGNIVSYAWALNTNPADASDNPMATGSGANFGHTFTMGNPPPSVPLYIHLTVTGLDGVPRHLALPPGGLLITLPPKATFTTTPPSGSAPLNVTLAGDDSAGGAVTSWAWDFGDGSPVDTASGANVLHQYVTPGIYTVTLNYANAGGGGTVTKQVLVTSDTEQVSAEIGGHSFQGTNGSIVVCYSNASQGPFVISDWDFGDGSPILRSSDPVVCHTYAAESTVTVTLNVCSLLSGGGMPDAGTPCVQGYDGDQSEWIETVQLIASPVANFASVSTVPWGTVVNFTNQSTGTITTYQWDFNGDGTPDLSGNFNDGNWSPSNIALNQLGTNLIRLTVYGPGGMSYVEHAIEVTRREITCAIVGPTSVLPTVTQSNYQSQVGDLNFPGFTPRTATYSWTLYKGATQLLTSTDTNLTVDWLPAYGSGNFTLTLSVITSDGVNCTTTQNITRDYQPIACYITTPPSFPSQLFADGEVYTFAVDVRNLDGRTNLAYQWYVNDVPQGGATGTTFAWQNTDVEPASSTPVKISYSVTVTNPDSSVPPPCVEELQFNVIPWPTAAAICANLAITGDFTPLPSPWDNPYTYSASLNSALVAGRTISYQWTVVNPPGEATTATNQASVGVRWHAQPPGITPGNPQPGSLSLHVVVTNPDSSVGADCTENEDIEVTLEPLECHTPTGDLTPLVGETLNYGATLHNLYARTLNNITWTITKVDAGGNPIEAPITFTYPPNSASVTASQSGNSGSTQLLSQFFPTEGERFTLSYTASVDADTANNIAAEGCSSDVATIVVRGTGVIFECESALTGSTNIPNAGGPYYYSISMDNGNHLILKYVYTLELINSSGGSLQSTVLATHTSANDGVIGDNEWSFTFAELSQWGAGRYRLTVAVTTANAALTPYTCGDDIIIVVGNLGVNYSYTIEPTGSQTWTANALPVGQEICLTNTTSPVPSTTHVNYTWSISPVSNNTLPGGTDYNAENLPCFTFTAEGNYTVTLTGANDSGTTVPSSSHSVTFRVYGLQSIAINRTGQLIVGNNNVFTAVGVNIDSYAWIFYRLNTGTNAYEQIATGSGVSVTRSFTPAGQYRARVIGTGDLGNTEAQIDFEILPANSIAARFSAVPNAGIAPYQVCFTDRSVSNPTSIVTWAWNFGDGNTSSAQNPCHTYQTPGPGNKYTVTLTVTNAANGQATATSIIRTYSLLESSVNFSYVDHGAGYLCFTPQDIPTGVIVTGWSFGDGSTGAPAGTSGLGEVCHTYVILGQTYTVVMYVEGPGGEEGEHSNDVTPNQDPPEPPILAVSAVCGLDRVATFVITNTGSEATDSVTIRNTSSSPVQVVYLSSHTFPDGSSTPSLTTITVPNQSGTVTLSLLNHSGTVVGTSTLTTECNYPPEIVITMQCVGYLPVFTITNNRLGDGPMVAAQHYTITDSEGNVIVDDTHSFQLQSSDPQAEVVHIAVENQNPYLHYTFSTAGTTVIVHAPVTSNCAAPAPDLSAAGECVGAFTFRITNGGSAMVLSQTYTIVDGSNNTVASGSFQLGAGEIETITLPNTLNPYAAAGYTLQSDGFAGSIDLNHPCASPNLVPSRECAYPVVFTITNEQGGNMLLTQSYTVENANGDEVASGTFQLAAGESETITLTGLDPYASYTLKSSGFAGTLDYTPDNCTLPAFTVTYTCAYPVVFTITNNGQLGDMLTAQPYTVEDVDGNVVDSGTFQLNVGESHNIPLTGLNPYASYTLKSSGFAGDIDETPEPCGQPVLVPQTQCAEIVSFTVTNNGAGNMLTAQSYTITDSSGSPVAAYTVTDDNGDPVTPGEMQLSAGASITITLTGANPYREFTFRTDGFAGSAELTHECADPVLVVTYTCASPVGFTVTNVGGDMLTEHSFEMYFNGSQRITPAQNKFLLLNGESLKIDAPSGLELWRGLSFVTGELGISADASFECVEPSLFVEPTPTPTPTQTSGGSGFSGLTLGAPNWNAVCGRNCPPFRVYHTDETGNWNIFRLDGANPETQETFRRNLSFGVGEGVRDMHPSLSPNNEWVVFTSNRDGNWEIYVASTGGDPSSVERVTHNTIANDTNPVWGPNNIVVYQSTRNGNWDLFAVDMETGVEYQLTDDLADDTNPTWSPDGSRLLFQSNRPDENGDRKWQIYELTLRNGAVRRLSDGTSIDVDPQYSNNGQQIVFRTYAEEGDASVLALMNANGGNRRTISDPNGDATNPAWSPQDRYIAYQSDLDGDLDIYIYELATGQTRHLSANDIPDYAPTWLCDEERVIFTSDINGTPDIYEEEVQPINGEPIPVERDAEQLTFEPFNNIYPLGSPLFEAASLEGQTSMGVFGEQTTFLLPDANGTPDDNTTAAQRRDDWQAINGCP